MKKTIFCLLFFAAYPTFSAGIIRKMTNTVSILKLNTKLAMEGNQSGYFLQKDGDIIFSGSRSPQWAIDEFLDYMDIEKGYGTGGIDPYKLYDLGQWKVSALYKYLKFKGYNSFSTKPIMVGSDIIVRAKRDLGRWMFKDVKTHRINTNVGIVFILSIMVFFMAMGCYYMVVKSKTKDDTTEGELKKQDKKKRYIIQEV